MIEARLNEFYRLARLMLITDEGRSTKPYRCSAGALTIGIGHNLDAKPISNAAIDVIFFDDLEDAIADVCIVIGYTSISEFIGTVPTPQALALVNMAFQLGRARFAKFTKLIAAVKRQDWPAAAMEYKTSLLAAQSKSRGPRVEGLFLGLNRYENVDL